MGKKVDVMVRTLADMRTIHKANPFPEEEPAKVAVVFLTAAPPLEELQGLAGPAGEQVRAGSRELYVYYPEGMGRSKLKLPLGGTPSTVRNMNTVAKLIAMAEN